MFYSIAELAKITGVSQRTLRDAIADGSLVPAYFGEKDGKAKVSDVEYNRWALSMQYGNNSGLLEEAMNVLNISVS